MKVAIIGYSGCGKSTLAKYIGKKCKVPVLHLDQVHWLPGWQERGQADSEGMGFEEVCRELGKIYEMEIFIRQSM